MQGADEFLASGKLSAQLAGIHDEQKVKRFLAAGAVLGFPTETVWGLGVTGDQASAVARLRHRKGRAADKAFQVLCRDVRVATVLVEPRVREGLKGLVQLWPGPLTLVVPAGPGCPPWLAQGGRVGLRVPDHPIPRRLAALAGGYLVGSSLNHSGEAPAVTQEEALALGLADLLITGTAAQGTPSTVFDAERGVILRAGGLPAERVLEAWQCAH